VFQTRAALNQMLLDVPDHELDVEVTRVPLGDFIDAVKDRLQGLQIGYQLDLLIQPFQFFQWIRVLYAHDVILH